MLNTSLELNINTLTEETLNMIQKCDEALEKAIRYMLTQDLEGAKQVIEEDDYIDEMREHIRDKSIELIALKQPMARDLRYIYALGSIAIDLERVGDYAVNISMETLKIGKEKHIKELKTIPEMAKVCREMLQGIKKSLQEDDYKLAHDIAKKDDIIDDLYAQAHTHCINVMHEDSNTINQGVRLLFTARYLERLGDHITNVCEKIVYAIDGNMIELG